MKRMWLIAICVMLFAVCFAGCHQTQTPAGTVAGKPEYSVPGSTDTVQQETQAAEQTEQAGQAGQHVDVTLPAEENNPEKETTEPAPGNVNDQQTNQNTQTPDDGKPTYEEYNAMSAEDQQTFYMSFADPQDFFDWYNKAKEEHEKDNQHIIVDGDGIIDLEDLMGGSAG